MPAFAHFPVEYAQRYVIPANQLVEPVFNQFLVQTIQTHRLLIVVLSFLDEFEC